MITIKKNILFASVFLNSICSFAQQSSIASPDKQKEITSEVELSNDALIIIKNAYRPLVLKTWKQSQIKLTVHASQDDQSKTTDNELLVKSGILAKLNNNIFTIESNSNLNDPPNQSNKGGNRPLILFIPEGHNVEIQNKYANIQVLSKFKQLKVDISNGNLETKTLEHLILNSKYSDFDGGDIKNAEISFYNGHFRAKNIENLNIYSETSYIFADTVKKSVIKSINDDYEFTNAESIECNKRFNVLKVDNLSSSIQIDGLNADITIKKFLPTVTLIAIKNKYSSLRLPIENLQNYALDFEGIYSKILGDFERTPVPIDHVIPDEPVPIHGVVVRNSVKRPDLKIDTTKIATVDSEDNNETSDNTQTKDPVKFVAKKGTGKNTRITVNCYNCRIDFR